MSTVNEIVRDSILCFPSLFANRSDVLHYVLCVVGNGYQWNDAGEVETKFVEDMVPWVPANRAVDETDEILKSVYQQADEKQNAENSVRVAEIDSRMDQMETIHNFYPQSDYALLMNIPENVTAEWAMVCEEMKTKAVVEGGWVF